MSQFIKLLRNQTLFATHDTAVAGLTSKLAALSDGEIALATYGTAGSAKTLLGIKRTDGNTIIDLEGISSDISLQIAGVIAKLDATVGTTTVATDKHVAVQVVESGGKLTALTVTESDIASAALLGTADDDKTKTTAFGKIAKEADDRATAIKNAIEALDSSVAATAADGNQYSVLTGVTEEDGKLTSKTEVKLAAVAKTGSASDVATTAITEDTTHVAVTGTNVSDQIDSLSTTLKKFQVGAAQYKVAKLTAEELAALSDSNVKEAYKLVSFTNPSGEKSQEGETIKIYKESSLKSADFVGEDGSGKKGNFLKLVYIKADGTEETVYVDMSAIVTEAEVKNGIAVDSDNKLYVKLAEGNESFLTVDANGVKLSGVQTAINAAIDGLDKTETTASATGAKVTVKYSQDNGIVSMSVTEDNIAPLDEFTTLKTAVGTVSSLKTTAKTDLVSAVNEVKDAVDSVTGDALTAIEGSNAISVSAKNAKKQTVSLKLDTTKADTVEGGNALSITTGETGGLYLSNVWDCGTY